MIREFQPIREMKPRTLIAVQFTLWAFFFSRIIPFSGDILLPVVWIYDKRVFAAFLVVNAIDLARYIPAALSIIPSKLLAQIPTWSVPWLIPLTLLYSTVGMIWAVWFSSIWLRRKIRKKAPDILELP